MEGPRFDPQPLQVRLVHTFSAPYFLPFWEVVCFILSPPEFRVKSNKTMVDTCKLRKAARAPILAYL